MRSGGFPEPRGDSHMSEKLSLTWTSGVALSWAYTGEPIVTCTASRGIWNPRKGGPFKPRFIIDRLPISKIIKFALSVWEPIRTNCSAWNTRETQIPFDNVHATEMKCDKPRLNDFFLEFNWSLGSTRPEGSRWKEKGIAALHKYKKICLRNSNVKGASP